MSNRFQLISARYLKSYASESTLDWRRIRHRLQVKSVYKSKDFDYYILASSLYSSKIEGNTLDVNSFFRQRGHKLTKKNKDVQEIENLASAYQFAATSKLTKPNFLKAHAFLSKTLLPARERGKVRTQAVGIRDAVTMKPVYLAVEPEYVNKELNRLFSDISILLKRKLSYNQIFYYASMMHLWIAAIHPFGDGNGRVARLIEKWFLVSKLGAAAWSIQSEKYYWDHRPEYYQNIALGFNYYALHWDRCLPFLQMLSNALKENLEE
jgi:Fic family protein